MGTDSANLDFFGHSRVHPLAEAYFTQAPIRYGAYVAKLAVVPVSPAQIALAHTDIDADDPNGLRTATVSYLRQHDAEFDVRVQLCTDLETMPVENASTEWPETRVPIGPLRGFACRSRRPSARLVASSSTACRSACRMASRRIGRLGSIMRARLRAYPEMSRLRRSTNGVTLAEPASVTEVPA